MQESPRRSITVMLAVTAIFLTLCLVLFPEDGVHAASTGLKLFWDVVFPSLLPFFILSELLLGLGIVNGLGVLLEPLMRPLFSVPGVGAFALSMGLAAGYPMDAVITARFRKDRLCTRIEGERLLAFTNTADPLFMFGSVAVGMFRNAGLGMLLAVAHYISAFLVGILFKLYGRGKDDEAIELTARVEHERFIVSRAFQEMIRAREEDGRPLGKLLGDAVNDSIKTLLMICGFIVFFAVLIMAMTKIGVIALLSLPLQALFNVLGIHTSLVGPTLSGFFEIDIGSLAVSHSVAPLVEKMLIVSAIIAWSGLSVHAQVASVLTNTDIRMRPYFVARVLHAVLAAVFTVVLFKIGMGPRAMAAFAPFHPATLSAPVTWLTQWVLTFQTMGLWAIAIFIVVVGSIAVYVAKRMRIVIWRKSR